MNANAAADPAARLDGLLRRELVVWFSTVRPNGLPHLVPIWFSWDGERLFVASKPDAGRSWWEPDLRARAPRAPRSRPAPGRRCRAD